MKHTIQQELKGVLAFLAVIWGIFLISRVAPFSMDAWGVTPRTMHGLPGIVAMPFLHADLHHLVSNSFPLLILLMLLAGSRAQSWVVVLGVGLLGGLLLWLFGRNATHVGASGLIFGLIAFLVVSGFLEGRIVPLLVALIVLFLYGGTLFTGILPQFGSHISWDGHLLGALAGAMIAYGLTRKGAGRTPIAPPDVS